MVGHAYGTGLGIPEAGNQGRDGCLSCARWAHECDDFPGGHVEADIVQHGGVRFVSERDVFEGNVEVHVVGRDSPGTVDDVRFLRQQREHGVDAGSRFLQDVVDRGERQEGLVDVAHIDDEDEQVGDTGVSAKRHVSACPDDEDKAQPTGRLDDSHWHHGYGVRAYHRVAEATATVLDEACPTVLLRERLDDGNAGEVILNEGYEVGQALTDAAPH